jgi:hypothetical protein
VRLFRNATCSSQYLLPPVWAGTLCRTRHTIASLAAERLSKAGVRKRPIAHSGKRSLRMPVPISPTTRSRRLELQEEQRLGRETWIMLRGRIPVG